MANQKNSLLNALLARKQLQISTGPGKWDLITKFANRESLMFTILIPGDETWYMKKLVISTLQHEDDSGESWIVTFHDTEEVKWSQYKVYFSSKNRKGFISSR